MSSIWPTKKLGEISKENIKSSFKVEDANNSGIFPFFTSGEDILTHSENLVDGENLFLSTGGYFHIKYYNGKAGYSSDTWSLRAKDGLTKYVYYQILAKLKFIDSLFFRGSGLRHLQKQEFLNIQIPLPPPPEQQKIVYVLDTIQETIGVQEKIIDKTKELKRAMMNLLFHYGTAILKVKEFASWRVGELTSEEFEKLTGQKLKKTEIGEIPESWEVVRLGDKKITEIIMGQSPSSDFYNQEGKGLPFLQGKAEFGDTYPSFTLWTNQPIKIAKKGDILLSVRAPIGDVNIANRDYCIGRGLAAIRASGNIDKIFLFYCLIYNKDVLENLGFGSTFKAIGSSIIRDFKIPFPFLSEQREIADILQTIDQKIETEQKKKALYEELFKAMLDKLMTGEIRVNDIDL